MPKFITHSEATKPPEQSAALAVPEMKSEAVAESEFQIGEWYWITSDFDRWGNKMKKPETWFGCVVKIGTNFVEFESPFGREERVLMDQLHLRVKKESDAVGYIGSQIERTKKEVEHWINEAKETARRLGVRDHLRLTEESQAQESNALVVCSGVVDTKAYQTALIEAKDKKLPEIFRMIKSSTEELQTWMTADTVHLGAIANNLNGIIGGIKGRIFTLALYAGISEEVVQIAEGKPAAFDERLHVMQRRCYMDEECLVNYKHGGMEFKHIADFDDWLVTKENLDRIMPFPRCMVSFRVRHHQKVREAFSVSQAFINFELSKLDELTFLYIKNGENVYRMNCELDFGHLMFSEHTAFDLVEPMMMHVNYHREVEKVISKRHYDELVDEFKTKVREYEAKVKLQKDWIKKHKKREKIISKQGNVTVAVDLCPYHPWYPSDDPREKYEQFDSSSVYFDEATKFVKDQIDQYNRIALIIQGIFDRSPMLHPHAPVKMWDGSSFNKAVKLVYDGTATLYNGKAPDFEAYRAACNAKIKVGSIVIGQDDYWEILEGKKESARRERSWRYSGKDSHCERHRPYGNPGPGEVTRVQAIRNTRNGKVAVFQWMRHRQRYNHYSDREMLPCKLEVPVDQLFNISAYVIGEYKRFFDDPRTRSNYLAWAPILLLAEEVHAGNYDVDKNLMKKDVDDGWTRDERGNKKKESENKKGDVVGQTTVYKDGSGFSYSGTHIEESDADEDKDDEDSESSDGEE